MEDDPAAGVVDLVVGHRQRFTDPAARVVDHENEGPLLPIGTVGKGRFDRIEETLTFGARKVFAVSVFVEEGEVGKRHFALI